MKCPKCGTHMEMDRSQVYTSLPPQYKFKCPNCGNMEFGTADKDYDDSITDNTIFDTKMKPKFKINDKINYNGDNYIIIGIGDNWYDVKVVLDPDSDFDAEYCTSIGFAAEDRIELVHEVELNEFEKRLKTIVNAYYQRWGEPYNIEAMTNKGAKNHAKWLLGDLGDKIEWTEEDESYYKSVIWHVSNSISNGKETNVKSDLTVWLEKLKNKLSN